MWHLLKLGHDLHFQMASNQDPWIPNHDQNLHQPSQFILPEKSPLQDAIQKYNPDKFQNLLTE